jgi:hypothetical protein
MEVSWNLPGGIDESLQQGMWVRVVGICPGVELGIFLVQVRNVTALAKLLCQIIHKIFLIGIVGGGVQLGPLGTTATNRTIVPVPGDYDDGEIGGMIGRGNRSTRRKPAPVPLCPLQTHMLPGREPRPPGWEASDYPLELRHGQIMHLPQCSTEQPSVRSLSSSHY